MIFRRDLVKDCVGFVAHRITFGGCLFSLQRSSKMSSPAKIIRFRAFTILEQHRVLPSCFDSE